MTKSQVFTPPGPPQWAQFAAKVIARLRARHVHLAALRRAAADGDDDAKIALIDYSYGDERARIDGATRAPMVASSTLDALALNPAFQHLPNDQWNAILAAGGDPWATTETGQNRPEIAIPPHELLVGLQLAAAFLTEERLREHLQPGAITVIHGLLTDDTRSFAALLREAILPDMWEAHATLQDRGGNVLHIVESGHREEALRERLGLRAPVFIARVVDDRNLPEEYTRAPCFQVELAPITPDLLIAMLTATHSATGRIDEAATRAALPAADALAKLSRNELLLALRAPTARAVAECLASMCAPRDAAPSSAMPPMPRLEDMANHSPAHATALRMVRDLVAWQAGTVDWSELTRSLLLRGLPGTGKTFLARAMGESAGVAFVQASFAEWQAAGHLGLMLASMRRSFEQARKAAPCVMFIDEIDAAGSRDDPDPHNRSYRDQVIDAFLQEVDALAREAGVLLVGACNNPARLDPAILRPGRFDLKLELPLPDRAFLAAMLHGALSENIAPHDLSVLARDAIGHTPATLDAAIRAARSDARHAGRPLDVCLLRVHLGVATENAADLHRVALHEAGHAVAAHLFRPNSVRRMQISQSDGFTEREPSPPLMLLSDIENLIVMHLSGRAAEQVILGAASSGAGGQPDSDLAIATRLAVALEHRYGFGDDGLLWSAEPILTVSSPPELRARVRKRLELAWLRACDLVQDNRDAIEILAAALLEHRDLAGEVLRQLLSETPTGSGPGHTVVPPAPAPEPRPIGASTAPPPSALASEANPPADGQNPQNSSLE